MSEKLLDDGLLDDSKKLHFYTYISPEFIEITEQLLYQNDIAFEIKLPHKATGLVEVRGLGMVPIATDSCQLFVAYSQKQKIDNLLEENAHLFEGKKIPERKRFLLKTLSEQKIKDIVIFPNEHDELDQKLALEILAEKGITLSGKEIENRKKEKKTSPNLLLKYLVLYPFLMLILVVVILFIILLIQAA